MIKNVYYEVNDINNKIIALFSDFHYVEKYDNNLILDIISNLRNNKPDYICLVGDIVDDAKILNNEISRNRLIAFFKFLGGIAPTFIVTGNHDQITYKWIKESFYDSKDFYSNLNIENVYYLDNKNKKIDNINFIGFIPDMKYYLKKPHEDKKILVDELSNIENLIEKSSYNVLLFHSPINILDKYVLEKCSFIKQLNLILSGHMHNGLTPEFLNKIKGNRGLISPYNVMFPKTARGLKIVEDTHLIISGGIAKITPRTSKFLSKLKYNKTSHIEYIKI